MNKSHKNVVVFGESGSGKSSLVNLLLGQNRAAVSDQAVGCTFNFQRYETPNFNVYDTIGLSEGSNGTVRADLAVKDLVSLLQSLHDGVSLLVFVVPKGRIKETLKKNYSLFVDCLCMKKVPVVLVITHCEMDSEPGAWWKENQQHFESYGMEFKAVISGSALSPSTIPEMMRPMIEDLNNKTAEELLKAIDSSILSIPWKHPGGWFEWFTFIATKSVQLLGALMAAKLVGKLVKSDIDSTAEMHEKRLKEYFKSEGLGVEESDEIVQHFNDDTAASDTDDEKDDYNCQLKDENKSQTKEDDKCEVKYW